MSCGKKSKIKNKKSLKLVDPVVGSAIYIEFTRKFEMENSCRAYTFIPDDKTSNPGIFFNLNAPLNVMTITHELLHALRYELTTRRTFSNLEFGEDEIIPYFLQYFFDKIVEFCSKNDIKIGMQ